MFDLNPKVLQMLKEEYSYIPEHCENESIFIPESKARDYYIKSFGKTRDYYIKSFGYVLISEAIIKILSNICKDKSVLDIGSGSGWLSYRLEQSGIDITALDNNSSHRPSKIWKLDIETNALTFDISSWDIIILSWPLYDDPFGYNILQKILDNQMLIYQGERSGGCTGDDNFHTYLNDNFTEDERLSDELNKEHLQFFGLHDWWFVYNRIGRLTHENT